MDLAQEKGASSWLTSLPFNLDLHKGAFHDAVALRYGWLPKNIPMHCLCGSSFTVDHALSCPKGGFPIMQHNEVRDLTANVMAKVCHDVCIEPTLQPVTGECLSGASTITGEGARLDIAASGFWGGLQERTYLMFESLTPMPPPIASPSPPATESMRTLKSVPMSIASVRLSMVPSLPSFSLQQEAWGNAANICYKRLASMIAKNMINPIAAPCSG